MARRQTRRTVSISLPDFERLQVLADSNDAPMSSLVEYTIARLTSAPLDVEAFNAWRAEHDREVTARWGDRWHRGMETRRERSRGETAETSAERFHKVRRPHPDRVAEAIVDPVITDEMRAEWRETIQRRMRGQHTTAKGRRAALLVLDDGRREVDAAKEVGISRQAVNLWVIKLRAQRAQEGVVADVG